MVDAFAHTAPLGDFAPGAIFAGRYAIVKPLGEGGMGRVYHVRDKELDEDVALKLLRAEIAQSPEALDRFRREVKLARRVTHTNVARTFDLGHHDGQRFLTMELIVGTSLSNIVRAQRPSLAEALRVAGEIARGLSAAHQVGVVHRDLKPDNVMIESDADARVVITDFGIAKEDDSRGNLDKTRSIVGTPAYMAPEQVEGRDLDGRCDVFALGVLMFEMLSGHLPFQGDTAMAIAAARLTAQAPDVRNTERTIPSIVAELVQHMLKRKREDRVDAATALRRIEAIRGVGNAMHLPDVVAKPTAAAAPRTLTVALSPLVSSQTPHLASELTSQAADALSKLKQIRVLPPATIAAAASKDPLAIGKATQADFVVEGSLMEAGERVRVRLGLVDVARGTQIDSARVEGTTSDPFTLEDGVTKVVVDWIKPRAVAHGERGPEDPTARDVYRKALEGYRSFSVEGLDTAISALEGAIAEHPSDPYLLSALAASYLRKCLMIDSADAEMLARADELALRAIAADPALPEALETMGTLRWHSGELRDAAGAFREALTRSPAAIDPQLHIAVLLCKSGNSDEGLRRLRALQRLEPRAVMPYAQEALAVCFDGIDNALEVIARGETASGHKTAFWILRARFSLWYGRRDIAAQVLANENEPWLAHEKVFRAIHLPVIRVFQARDLERADVEPRIADLTARDVLPLSKALFLQHATELAAAARWTDGTLTLLERLSRTCFIDVPWIDRCPLLGFVRDDASFSDARARIATRAAHLW